MIVQNALNHCINVRLDVSLAICTEVTRVASGRVGHWPGCQARAGGIEGERCASSVQMLVRQSGLDASGVRGALGITRHTYREPFRTTAVMYHQADSLQLGD